MQTPLCPFLSETCSNSQYDLPGSYVAFDGWLYYEVGYAGEKSVHKLGPAETNTKQARVCSSCCPIKRLPAADLSAYEGDVLLAFRWKQLPGQ